MYLVYINNKRTDFVKKITEDPNINTRTENVEAVVYKDAIPGSNFKSLFKSIMSNQQNLNQVGID